MPIPITVTVDNPDELLNVGMYGAGALIRWESAALQAGPFAEGGTTVLVAGKSSYVVYDPAGTSASWYRVRYSDALNATSSDYSDVFQVGAAGGMLCDLVDVRQRLKMASAFTGDDEYLIECIAEVTDEIIGYTGRQFVPDPLSGTKTIYLDYSGDGETLWMPKGVRSLTYLGVASMAQPGDGTGTYSEIASGSYYLDPPEQDRSHGWPATRITLVTSGGSVLARGHRAVKATGSFGWATVPPTIARIAQNVVVRRYLARDSGRGGPDIVLGSPDMAMTTLRDVSPEERSRLDWYCDRNPV